VKDEIQGDLSWTRGCTGKGIYIGPVSEEWDGMGWDGMGELDLHI
jgi:hypothetical protein